MKGVIRKGDYCTGHGCFPPRSVLEGSNTVYINGKNVSRIGDKWAVHACPKIPPHEGISIEGSHSIFANGKCITRTDDAISCGSKAGVGSTNVFAG